MKNALDKALAHDVCRDCDDPIALVDAAKKKGVIVGGQWVHVDLPDEVHPARPL